MVECATTGTVKDALLVDLKKDITTSQPASLLLFSISDLDITRALQVPNTTFIDSAEALMSYLKTPSTNPKFDLAIVILSCEDVQNDHCIYLLSKLRDTDSARVYLACWVPFETANKNYDTCFRALGFKLLNVYQPRTAGEMNIHLFYYDIYDYKEVPDWLNNRFWAHPDRWNKARW